MGALPDVTGLDPAAAKAALEGAGIHVGDLRDSPSLEPSGTVAGLRYRGARIDPRTQLAPGSSVDLDIADGSKPILAVAGIGNYGCALTEDHLVYCMGVNDYGQLGNGGTDDSATPVLVDGLRGVTAIAVGEQMSCALLADHSVMCWGQKRVGQLGDGSFTDQHRPVFVSGLHDAEKIATNGSNTCAVRFDRTVWCWGMGLIEGSPIGGR